jgi:hypothetical protein
MQLELHIEALTLHGLPALDYDRFGAALESELGWLFESHGIPATLTRSWEAAQIQLDQLRLPAGAGPELAAAYVAQQLYEGLNGSAFAQAASSIESVESIHT